MPDARPRHVVLTGPTSGIGLEAARALAAAGARLTLVGRDEARLSALAAELGSADRVVADLSSLEQTRQAAAAIHDRHDRIDVLINNAGGMFRQRTETAEGIESTLALNHLSPFVLTLELLPLLRAAADHDREFGARVVNVASSAHRSSVHWDDIALEHGYSLMRAYGQSKALMVMTTIELARRLDGSGVIANSMHPGVVRTGIVQKSGHGLIGSLIVLVGYAVLDRPKRGGSHLVHLALSEAAAGVSGAYWNKRRVEEPSEEARARANQERAWALSERLAGMTASG
ncbi:MAG: SDR family NAD(P)-dependent oxidoreductase [Chloroflexi bacterium]|nr:SDR family NAD(P)-dependent oxidoreductase [Chloroflexota bacterium]